MAVPMSRCRVVLLICNISTVYLSLGLLLSLQPPFYPSEAEKKGAKPAEYGFVFGIANLSLFIFSPLFGNYGSRFIGAKLCFTLGAVLQGLSGFSFSLLPALEDAVPFLAASYALRFAEGAGTAMAWSSALGILMQMFPDKVARVMSWTQTCFGLGYMLGPAVGAALYEIGGFSLPFMVVGTLSTLLSLGLVATLPEEYKEEEEDDTLLNSSEEEEKKPSLKFCTILTSPLLLLPFVDLFVALCGSGMLEAMLEPHMKEELRGTTTLDVGVTFLIFGGSYMVGNVVLGVVMDKFRFPILFSILGNILFFVTFLLIGPAPFLPFKSSKNLIQGMMALAGLAYSSLVISSFSRAQSKVLEMGHEYDINTYVMISGIWMSAFALGNFSGPTLGGALVETAGFAWTATVFLGLYAVMLLVDLVLAADSIRRRRRESREGYQQLQ